MSNNIKVKGTISYITLRATSLFMTVKEDGAHGVKQTVKAYTPQHLKETPEIWSQAFAHLEVGMRVIVEGRMSFDKETMLDQASQQQVAIRHPTQDRDLYSPYIWATAIDAIFDPALHTKRTHQQNNAQRPPQRTPPPPAQQRSVPQPSPSSDSDELPPPPMAWNS